MPNEHGQPTCPHCGRPLETVFEGFAPGSLHCPHCIRDTVDRNARKVMAQQSPAPEGGAPKRRVS